jgi:putative hydrolase of the HAD superfamily
MGNPILGVIFDYGGVLCLPPDAAAVLEMAALCCLGRAEFLERYFGERTALDRGTIDHDMYWRKIFVPGVNSQWADVLGRLVQADQRAWGRINTRVLAWSRELRRAGMKTAILSNMPRIMLDVMREVGGFSWLDEFAPRLYSCDVGLVKPQPEFYRLCLAELGLEAGQCVFIDDSAVNVRCAKDMGIHSFVFHGADQAAGELAGLLSTGGSAG